ncbi:MAG: hypothetical protein AAGG08_11965, partial [Actinomycetota bacterium]
MNTSSTLALDSAPITNAPIDIESALVEPVPVFHAPAQRATTTRVSPYGPSEDVPISDFEVTFRQRLTELGAPADAAPSADRPRRSTITSVVTALRSAITADRLLAVARGLTPQDVAEAYDHLEHLRATSAGAVARLVADPTPESFGREHGALLPYLPQMTASLERVATHHPDSFEDAVDHLGQQ